MLRRLLRIITIFVLLNAFVTVLPVSAQATNTTFVLSPAKTSVKVGDTFVVTIQIKSDTSIQSNYARAILVFDPTRLQIDKAEQGSLYCQYPTDGANFASDNTKGQLMITGTSSGTSTCPYPQLTSTAATFATITFKTKKAGTASLSFLYNGQLADAQSGITKAGSPPVFVMSVPSDGSYTVTGGTTPSPPPNLGVDGSTLAVGAFALTILGWMLMKKQEKGPRVVTVSD